LAREEGMTIIYQHLPQWILEYQPSQPPPPAISGVMAMSGGLLEIPKGSGELGQEDLGQRDTYHKS